VALHTSGAQCQLAIIYYFGVAFVSTKNERAMDMLAKGGLKMERGLNTNKKERKKWRKRLGGGETGNTHASDFLLLWQPPHGHTLLSIYTSTHIYLYVESAQRNI